MVRTLALAAITLFSLTATAHGEFTTIAGWNNQLFPSFAVATATIRRPQPAEGEEVDETILGDANGVLGVQVESPGDNVKIKVTISGSEIMEPSTFTGTLESEGETYTIYPRIRYKFGVLTQNRQATPVTVTFKVQIEGEDAEEQTETLTLRSINDCPFAVVEGEDGDEEVTDLSFMFAAYVNEAHPFVDKVLREALDTGIVDSFTGYQSRDKAEVYRQVLALWVALCGRDVRYSNITTSVAESDTVYSQHVRLLDETINNAQANCVDGSVLFASLLRKVGIEPYLVMVPGHCYLAFALDEQCEDVVALETTLIGGGAPGKFKEIKGLRKLISKEAAGDPSYATFSVAIEMGTADLRKYKDKFEADDEPNYLLMPVTAARKMGILPIGFKSNAQFTPAGGE